jgi:hypothetical protein
MTVVDARSVRTKDVPKSEVPPGCLFSPVRAVGKVIAVALVALLVVLLSTREAWADTRSAIRRLAPPRAMRWARIIDQEAARRLIDPLLVVAFIHVETGRRWDPRLVSPTADYGLTQVHVAVRGSETFLGREEQLFDPRTNIREWCRLAAMWRDYHARTCIPGKHRWWAHLQWGYRVRDTTHAEKVLRLYRWLKGDSCCSTVS